MISEDSQCGIEANGKFIPINSVTAKSVYNLCISYKFLPPTSKNFCQLNLTLKTRKPGPQFIYYRWCKIGHKNQNVPVQDFK